MRSIIIEVSDGENGSFNLNTKTVGNFSAFEVIGILESVKHNVMMSDTTEVKQKKKKSANKKH